MPRQDGTGPQGYGPGTGGGFGPCGAGLQRGLGRDYGRGFRQRFAPMQSPVITEVQEKEFLEQELQTVEAEKQGIEKRLKELRK